MQKNKKTNRLGTIITIVLLIVLVFLSNLKLNKFSYIENSFSSLITPIQNGLTYLKNKLSGNNTFFTDIKNLKQENTELRDKNSELEEKLRELEMMKAENETLKEELNLTEKYSEYKGKSAYVIDRDISNYSSDIVINIGAKDGVKENMTVIADKGLVGHVISVTENTSKVQAIVDPASSVSCTISSSKDGIIAKGTIEGTSQLKATYIPVEADVVQNDSIETSGLGGIYPKGIYVGTIDKVVNKNNITDRYALIDTAVDFSKLDTVLVIMNQN